MAEDDDTLRHLVDDARSGDRDAFARLLESHYDRIHQLAWRWCRNRHDAEEITQEVCIKLVSAIHDFRGEAAFSSWLYRVTLNTASDYSRRSKRRRDREEESVQACDSGISQATQEDALHARLIRLCLTRLPDMLRRAVLLVHGEGLSHRKAGDVLECAEGTVSWRLSEARKRLNDCLTQGG
ncbi:MAG: RNA polymerase sigma factor [Magnetococcales bacterium]|nr:RNA polymerase sigma factor [Magnetococcales bacterium]